MSYNENLSHRVRIYLNATPNIYVQEKKMFGGLAFLVNGKMCINVGADKLMCRFDPTLTDYVAQKTGFLPMIMQGKELKGYCYVEPTGFESKEDLDFWLKLCLDFNERAKASIKK